MQELICFSAFLYHYIDSSAWGYKEGGAITPLNLPLIIMLLKFPIILSSNSFSSSTYYSPKLFSKVMPGAQVQATSHVFSVVVQIQLLAIILASTKLALKS